jgi:hypothetical protein
VPADVHGLILWAGFVGAWLLVAGPIWQAVVELRDEDFEREKYTAAMDVVPPREQVSTWWWLVPPLHFVLNQRSKGRWQDDIMAALPDEDYEALSSFMSKVRGWMLVGGGGLLIATKETYELVEGNEWPTGIFWVLIVVMALAAASQAAFQVARADRAAEQRRATRPVP